MDDYDELEKAMSLIKSRRKCQKKTHVAKHISTPLLKINNHQVSVVLGITYNINTHNFWLANGLMAYRQQFYPTKHERDYSIEHVLKLLENNRENTKKQNAKRTKESRTKYYQKNRKKINEQKRIKYHKNKINNNN